MSTVGAQYIGNMAQNVWRESLGWGIHFRLGKVGLGRRAVGAGKIQGL